jgi:predicted phage gp36 major capsid-like protein
MPWHEPEEDLYRESMPEPLRLTNAESEHWQRRAESAEAENKRLRSELERAWRENQRDRIAMLEADVARLREDLLRIARGDVPGEGDWGDRMMVFAAKAWRRDHA